MLLSGINLSYYQELMQGMREAIADRAARGLPRRREGRVGEGGYSGGVRYGGRTRYPKTVIARLDRAIQ